MPSTINSLAWKFSESVVSQLVSLLISIIVARILGPEAYGVVALVTIFTSIAQVFIDGGFNSALIQKKNADKIDFSTVFYFSVSFSVILYIILYFSAPAISRFYGSQYENLTQVFRVLGVTLIIYAINGVQTAYVQKQMMFKNFFWAKLVGSIVSGGVAIWMAYSGYGVWALVALNIVSGIVNTFTLFVITRKLPAFVFSFSRWRKLFDFGVKVFATDFIIKVYLEIRALIIGKMYSASDLALYNRASSYPNLLVGNINSSLSSVLYPRMSLEQDNLIFMKDYLRRSLRVSTYTLSPLLFGLAACAEPFIRILLTDKWIDCVPYMQVLCFVMLFQPLSTINNQAVRAMGHSGMILKLELIKKSIELITLLLVMRISVMAIVVNMLVMAAVLQLLFVYPNKKYLGYTFKQQMLDFCPGILLGGIMMIAIYPINLLNIADIWKLVIEVLAGVLIYVSLSKLTHNKEYAFIKGVILSKLKW